MSIIKSQLRACLRKAPYIGFTIQDEKLLISLSENFSEYCEFPLQGIIPLIIELKNDSNWNVRYGVIETLSYLEVVNDKSIGAVDYLIEIMKYDENKGIRVVASWELKQLEQPLLTQLISEKQIIKSAIDAFEDELDKNLQFIVAVILAKTEGKRRRGIGVIEEMIEKDQLNQQQKEEYKMLCQELKIQPIV